MTCHSLEHTLIQQAILRARASAVGLVKRNEGPHDAHSASKWESDPNAAQVHWFAGPFVGTAVYEATANFSWHLNVNVVKIVVGMPVLNAFNPVAFSNNENTHERLYQRTASGR